MVGASTVAYAGAAQAAPSETPVVTTRVIEASRLLGAAQNGATGVTELKSAVQSHLQARARSGRILDSSRVETATGVDPVTKTEVTSVWEDGYAPAKFNLVTAKASAGGAAGLGVVYGEDSNETKLAQTGAGGGFGFAGAVSYKGMYKYTSEVCSTTKFQEDYSPGSNNHSLTSCFEKYAQSGTNRWIYNRWALFTKGSGNLISNPEITEFTIRTRPWSTKKDLVYATGSWIPQKGGTTCSVTSPVTLKFDVAEVTVPIHQCENLTMIPDATEHSLAAKWTGSTPDQRFLDMAYNITAKDNKVVPVMADYSWATVRYCTFPSNPTDCFNNDNNLVKDPGW